jgi:hypothetical protein
LATVALLSTFSQSEASLRSQPYQQAEIASETGTLRVCDPVTKICYDIQSSPFEETAVVSQSPGPVSPYSQNVVSTQYSSNSSAGSYQHSPQYSYSYSTSSEGYGSSGDGYSSAHHSNSRLRSDGRLLAGFKPVRNTLRALFCRR